jgi:YARHG domain
LAVLPESHPVTRIAPLLLFAACLAQPAIAGAGPEFMTCNELWTSRNQIFKDQGYCFRTARAIRVFGNAGCRFDQIADVPLSASQRAEIGEIERYEQIRACAR